MTTNTSTRRFYKKDRAPSPRGIQKSLDRQHFPRDGQSLSRHGPGCPVKILSAFADVAQAPRLTEGSGC